MFGTQIDDPVTMTTPPKADPVVTGAKIRGFQIDPIRPPLTLVCVVCAPLDSLVDSPAEIRCLNHPQLNEKTSAYESFINQNRYCQCYNDLVQLSQQQDLSLSSSSLKYIIRGGSTNQQIILRVHFIMFVTSVS